ncbi:MAG: PD40 domain-containing protein [Fidelibacterota bacterium]|nr:MAG: PD40 domain-containing protein [Candidatus Neomarinimicrobiota bacterium]
MEYKNRSMLWIILLVSLSIFSCAESPAETEDDEYDFTNLGGEYLGQTPPGRTFVRFAPHIITDEMIHSVTASPDSQEIYWAERNGIMVTKLIDGRWTTPELASFSQGRTDFYDDAPVVSPDNTKLYFNSRRPSGYAAVSGYSFWYCERTASGWSEPQTLPAVINETGGIHWQVSVSDSGTLYFGIISGAAIEIYSSRLVDGAYATPEPLDVINSLGWVICPFIAPDESYIIFNKVENGGALVEYYISFKGNDNQWLAPQRLTQFPSGESSFVTRDGSYVFCKSYWASAQIIEDLRPD